MRFEYEDYYFEYPVKDKRNIKEEDERYRTNGGMEDSFDCGDFQYLGGCALNRTAEIVFAPDKNTWHSTETLSGYVTFSEEAMKSGRSCDMFVFWTVDSIGTPDVGVVYRGGLNIKTINTHHFSVRLPALPLSYSGELFRIRWMVRLRLFKRGAEDVIVDREFVVEEPQSKETLVFS
jgi:hypothetical protein